MNQKSSHLLGKLIALAVFILLGITACAPAVADAANIPLAAAALNHAEVASFENRLTRIELNGTLEQIGEQSAVVDGQTFRLDEQSVVVSALKPGDRVQVKAVLLPDNSLYAQSVKLDLSASSNSSFKFYGFVESMQSEVWQISSTFVQVHSSTVISGGIQTGSFVEVEGRVLNGQLVADKIQLEGDDTQKATITPGVPGSGEVEFYGKIESIQNGVYVIDGRTVRTTAQTEIKGMLAVGMMVKVHAALQNDATYLAREIEAAEGDDTGKTATPGVPGSGEVEFYGKIESIQNGVYVIDGRTVRTTAQTEIKGMLAVGMMVKVHAVLQNDATYLAREIEAAEGDDTGKTATPGVPGSGEVEFYGKIESIQNGVYVIDGRTVRTTAQTKIKGMLAVGMMVKVHAALQTDGSYLAREIELTSGDDIYDDDNDGKSDDDNHDDGNDDDNDGKSDDDNHDDGNDDDNDGKSDDDNHDDGNDDDNDGKSDDDNKKGKDK